MNLPGIDVSTIERAIALYCSLAWPGKASSELKRVFWNENLSTDQVLAQIHGESADSRLKRFTLRLGNQFYPHMKVVLQDFLLPNYFSFSVDTHDDHFDVGPECGGYDAWLAIKQRNADLKQEVEDSWAREGIPTLADVVARLEKETPPGAAASSDGGPLVLIVDDEPKWSRGAHLVMLGEGSRTAIVESAEAAVAFLDTNQPDLILSDWEMGLMTGLEFARWLRAQSGRPRIPFILMSAGRARPVGETSIDEFLAKPYEKATLASLVREHLAKRASPNGGPDRSEKP